MAVPWYEWRPIRNRLLSYARAVQGISPYRVTLEPDKSKCSGGYTNFSHRLITVNPTMFEAPSREQYDLTKAVLCHEAGHRRFTTPTPLPAHIHFISNLLEDDRIERLMEEEFAGVRPLLRKLSEQMLKEATPLDPGNDSPIQVLSYILQLRWATRCGLTVKGKLSQINWERWQLVESLVYEAWKAASSEVCDRNAREIIRILEIEERDIPQWLRDLLEKMEVIEGQRHSSDPAEAISPQDENSQEVNFPSDQPFDGEPVPHEHAAGAGEHIIVPQPYLSLVEKVQPLTRKLLEELETENALPPLEVSERGGRWFLRQYLRDRSRPFILPQDERRSPPTLTFRVVIDHSSSMNFEGRIEYAAQAAMLLHLAAVEMAIPHQIVVTPDCIKVADLKSGELGLALIAGIVPAPSGWEDTGLAVSCHGSQLAARNEDIKLLMVIHDGMGNDHEQLTRECNRLRDKVLILGVGLGLGEMEAGLLKEQFGPDRYIHCAQPEELPAKVGGVIRAIRGV